MALLKLNYIIISACTEFLFVHKKKYTVAFQHLLDMYI